MIRGSLKIFLSAVGLLGPPLGAATAENWRLLAAPHFTVVSQWSEADTRAWAREFSQFVFALRHVLVVDERRLPPLAVVLFAHGEDFKLYDPIMADGRILEEAGFFGRQPSGAVIGLFPQGREAGTRHVIFHEGVHWYLSATSDFRPLALEEGLAEVFSTFHTAQDREYFGGVIEPHLQLLRGATLMPVEQLLAVGAYDPVAARHGIGLFYAESWALVHYLMFGADSAGGAPLDRLLAAFARQLPLREALRQALGRTPAQLDFLLGEYLRNGNYHLAQFPTDAQAGPGGPAGPAPPAVVETALSRLAAVSPGHADLALGHAQEAVRLAPDFPDGYDVLAVAYVEHQQAGEALAAIEQAARLGSKNAWTLALHAKAQARARGER